MGNAHICKGLLVPDRLIASGAYSRYLMYGSVRSSASHRFCTQMRGLLKQKEGMPMKLGKSGLAFELVPTANQSILAVDGWLKKL